MSKGEQINLMHPEHGLPAVADVLRYYINPANGRNIGQVLRFPDGIYSLTYGEIRVLRNKLKQQRAPAD